MCGIQYTFKNIISIIPGGGRRTKSPFKKVHTKEEPLLEVFLKKLWLHRSLLAPVLRHLCNSGRTEHICAVAIDFDKSPGLCGMQRIL